MSEPIIITQAQCAVANVVWDLDWYEDDELSILADKFGPKGPHVFNVIACQIGRRGGFYPKELLQSIATKARVTLADVEIIVEECARLKILHVSEHGITSKRMQREIEKTVRMKLSKKLKGDPILFFPWSIPSDPGSENKNLGSETSDPSKLSKEEKSKEKVSTEKKSQRPQGWEKLTSDLQAEIPKWIEFREQKKKPLGFSEIDAIIADGLRDPAGTLRSLRASRKNGHTTLYAVPEEARAGPKSFDDQDRAKWEESKKKFLAGDA